MSYKVFASSAKEIDFAPASELKEILQNVQTIITTIKGTIPLDREFGISSEVIDAPMQVAQAKLSNEVFQAIKKYEPRVNIVGIEFEADINGRLWPIVEVSVNETERTERR